MRQNRALVILFLLLFSSAGLADVTTYIVKDGDTFSDIARLHFGFPLYTADGSIARLKKLNTQIKDENLIFPGQVIQLGESAMQTIVDMRAPAAASTATTETPTVTEPIQAQKDVNHELLLSADYGITTLTATDLSTNSKAQLDSSYDVAISAGWLQHWSESFSTALAARLREVAFEQPSNSDKSLSHASQSLSGLVINFENKLSSRCRVLYGLNYESELFLHGASTTVVTVDTVPVGSVFGSVVYEAFKKGRTTLGLKAGLEYLMPASADGYSVKAGSAYSGAAYLKREYGEGRNVELDLAYRYRTQNTSVVDLNEQSVLAILIFSLPIFEEGKK